MEDGSEVPPGTQPLPRSDRIKGDWFPFENEKQFRMGDFLYRRAQMSAGELDELFDLMGSPSNPAAEGECCDAALQDGLFKSHQDLYAAIDAIPLGDAPWKSFTATYSGEIGPNPPNWQLQDYTVWFRDPDVVIKNLLDNPDFDGSFEYAPYVEMTSTGERKWSEFMSGNLAYRHAVRFRFHILPAAVIGKV